MPTPLRSAFPVACFCGLSGAHECMGALEMALMLAEK